MTGFYFTEDALVGLRAVTWLGVGAVVGALYFLTLRWNVRILLPGPLLLLGIALQLGRFALLAGVLSVIAACFGALSLLLATAGILVARAASVRWGEQT